MTGPASAPSVTRTVQVVNRTGLHARPCHAIVQAAMGHPCTLRIRKKEDAAGDGVNGKSILELMTLEASQGTTLELISEGEGGAELLEVLAEVFARGFDEELK